MEGLRLNKRNPVFTEATECQDCYKCLRECPVKAIKVENGRAEILPDLCILCGHCVTVCPAGAKKVRNDLPRVKALVNKAGRENIPVIVSLAPSFWGEHPEVTAAEAAAVLGALGFSRVSETALGAELVTEATRRRLTEGGETDGGDEDHAGCKGCAGGEILSSACPVVVEYLQKYRPDLLPRLSSLASPLVHHARYLRGWLEGEVRIVFFGPCIAKKREADLFPQLVDAALTFQDLAVWMEDEGLCWGGRAGRREGAAEFFPRPAQQGRIYPLDGGMAETLQGCGGAEVIALSGIRLIQDALEELPGGGAGEAGEKPAFLELLGCEGGCVYGPVSWARGRGLGRIRGVRAFRQAGEPSPGGGSSGTPEGPGMDLGGRLEVHAGEGVLGREGRPAVPGEGEVSPAELQEALAAVGKTGPADEMNCGGCGYDTCRNFARAMARGRAERTMCVSYLRRLAQKKADALIRTMPSGVVIVDENLQIVESNASLARILGEEAEDLYQVKPGLAGARIGKLLPFGHLFERVLTQGGEILNEDFRMEGRILHGSIFPIEEGRLAGGLFQDVTVPWVQRDRIVRQTREVIEKNLATVQNIAYLLGENAAESEGILHSIIESFEREAYDGDSCGG